MCECVLQISSERAKEKGASDEQQDEAKQQQEQEAAQKREEELTQSLKRAELKFKSETDRAQVSYHIQFPFPSRPSFSSLLFPSVCVSEPILSNRIMCSHPQAAENRMRALEEAAQKRAEAIQQQHSQSQACSLHSLVSFLLFLIRLLY